MKEISESNSNKKFELIINKLKTFYYSQKQFFKEIKHLHDSFGNLYENFRIMFINLIKFNLDETVDYKKIIFEFFEKDNLLGPTIVSD